VLNGRPWGGQEPASQVSEEGWIERHTALVYVASQPHGISRMLLVPLPLKLTCINPPCLPCLSQVRDEDLPARSVHDREGQQRRGPDGCGGEALETQYHSCFSLSSSSCFSCRLSINSTLMFCRAHVEFGLPVSNTQDWSLFMARWLVTCPYFLPCLPSFFPHLHLSSPNPIQPNPIAPGERPDHGRPVPRRGGSRAC